VPFTVLICPHVTALAESYQIIGGTIRLVVVDVVPAKAPTLAPAVWILALVAISFKDHCAEFSVLEIKSVWIGSYPAPPVPMIPTLSTITHFLPRFRRMLVTEKVCIPEHRFTQSFLDIIGYALAEHRVILPGHPPAKRLPEFIIPGVAYVLTVVGTEGPPCECLAYFLPAFWRPLTP